MMTMTNTTDAFVTDVDELAQETAALSVYIGLILISAISFWCQAVLTEERFVPALNVIANYFNIPDDVAGATLMAAGASSPELFSSFVSLFITHSALGLGTIVGSEIFNQLIICAGAVFAAKSGNLRLNKAVVIREVGFYALSIALLLYALRDSEPVDDDPLGGNHIFISFTEASLVFSAYIAYVIVCGNFPAIVDFFSKRDGFADKRGDYGSTDSGRSKRVLIDLPDLPFMKETYNREPSDNFKDPASQIQLTDGTVKTELAGLFVTPDGDARPSRESSGRPTSSVLDLISRGKFSDGASVRLFGFTVNVEKPSDEHDFYDLVANEFDETLSCFLWQRSFFYNKARIAMHGWHLRWFMFTRDKVVSVPNRASYNKYQLTYPLFEEIELDESRCVIKINNMVKGKRDYYFMAPSRKILDSVVLKMEEIMERRASESGDTSDDHNPTSVNNDEVVNSFEERSLIEFPTDGFVHEILLYVFLFPFKFLMHHTIPDVRTFSPGGDPTASLFTALMAVIACLLWLIVASYAMVTSLTDLADLMNIPDAVMGVTLAAAGTSLPNYVASKVAAEQGFGNMAVSNAFGSNTFNIMVGLGLPWTLYIAFGNNLQPYHGLRDEGITESVIILASVLLVFVVLVLFSDFVLYKWHGYMFMTLYVAYLGYAVIRFM